MLAGTIPIFTYWTEEQQTQFWSEVDAVIEPWIQEIVDYCVAAGAVAEGATIAEAAAQWDMPTWLPTPLLWTSSTPSLPSIPLL